MNKLSARNIVLISLSINLALVGIAFILHPGVRHEFSSLSYVQFAGSLIFTVGLVIVFCWPWLLALMPSRACYSFSVTVFSVISIVSAIVFFIPSPLHPEEALGYHVATHLFVVWLAYPLSLIFRLGAKSNSASNKQIHPTPKNGAAD